MSGARFRTIAADSTIDTGSLAADSDWLLVFGDHSLLPPSQHVMNIGDARLVRLASGRSLDFRSSRWLGIVASTRGLSGAEAWGTWSDGPRVVIDFVEPLPDRFEVRLTASAFGPNIGKPFRLKAGKSDFEFVMGNGIDSYEFVIDNPAGATTLEILVPEPTSPMQLGLSADVRLLGLGLRTLEIDALED